MISTVLGPPSTRRPTLDLTFRVATAMVLAAIYYGSFRGIERVEKELNALPLADANHYFQQLHEGGYLHDATSASTGSDLHRKAVHHIGYYITADVLRRFFMSLAFAQDAAIWLVSPVLGAVNFLLMLAVLLRRAPAQTAWPLAVAYALIPGTWIYASVPESWTFVGTAVLVVLWGSRRKHFAWTLNAAIGVLALANFFLLFTALLTVTPGDFSRHSWRRGIGLLVLPFFTWFVVLVAIGSLLSPDFLPHRFARLTLEFKQIFPENLSIVHPARWSYNAVNLFALPFVLNQPRLHISPIALLHSVRSFPLGTLAVVGMAALYGVALRRLLRMLRESCRDRSGIDEWGPHLFYLFVVFIATGMAVYYESFLYCALVVPVLFSLLSAAVSDCRRAMVCLWAVTLIWAGNSIQQVVRFRMALSE